MLIVQKLQEALKEARRVQRMSGGGVPGVMVPTEEPRLYSNSERRRLNRSPLKLALAEAPWLDDFISPFKKKLRWKDPLVSMEVKLDVDDRILGTGELSIIFEEKERTIEISMNLFDIELTYGEEEIEDMGRERSAFLRVENSKGFVIFDKDIGPIHMPLLLYKKVLDGLNQIK